MYNVAFVDEQHGWMTGGIASDTTVYRSTDGGLTWRGIFHWQQLLPQDVAFWDTRRGAIPEGTRVAVTFDGGDSWVIAPVGDSTVEDDLLRVVYASATRVVGVGARYEETRTRAVIWISDDAGVHWRAVYIRPGPASGTFFHLARNRYDGTLITPDAGEIYRSTTEGSTWSHSGNSALEAVYGLAGAGPGVFIAVGRIPVGESLNAPAISRSSDGGQSWNLVWSAPEMAGGMYARLYSVEFPDSLHGWAGGPLGLMLNTSDGGLTWDSLRLPDSGRWIADLSFVSPDLGWAVDSFEDDPPSTYTRLYRYGEPSGSWDRPRRAPAPAQPTLSVFPNPANPGARLTWTIPWPGDVRLELYDLLGRQVWAEQFWQAGGTQSRWQDFSGLSTGMYFYRLTCRDRMSPIVRLVVQK